MMRRRNALKQLALGAGGLWRLPAWANNWNLHSLPANDSWLMADQVALLADIVETIIPATNRAGVTSPGAGALNVHAFVQNMVTDCFPKDVQVSFSNGLTALEEQANRQHVKAFADCDASQRLAILSSLEHSPNKPTQEFIMLAKRLTIQGYSTSEYVMTTFYNYQQIPGHYYGCVPILSTSNAQPK